MKDPKTVSEELKEMFDEPDKSGQAEAFRQMYNSKDISLKTEFNKKVGEADEFARMSTLARMLKIPILQFYVNEAEKKRVSNDRLGRKEGVQMIQQTPQPEKRGIFGSIFR